MKDDIIAGIRNAMERGYSLQQAVQSFLNAGYNPLDVREAQNAVSRGVSGIVYPESTVVGNKDDHTMPETPSPPKSGGAIDIGEKKKLSSGILIAIVIIALIVFVGALSYLIYTLVK